MVTRDQPEGKVLIAVINGSKGTASIVRVADKGIVPRMEAPVEAQIELIAQERTGEDSSEWSELRSARAESRGLPAGRYARNW